MRNVRASDPAISDHCAVHSETLCLIKPSFERRSITYRKLRSRDSGLYSRYHEFDAADATDCYTSTLRSLLDKYAPAKSRIVTIRPAAP